MNKSIPIGMFEQMSKRKEELFAARRKIMEVKRALEVLIKLETEALLVKVDSDLVVKSVEELIEEAKEELKELDREIERAK